MNCTDMKTQEVFVMYKTQLGTINSKRGSGTRYIVGDNEYTQRSCRPILDKLSINEDIVLYNDPKKKRRCPILQNPKN